MRHYLTAYDIANNVRMSRTLHFGTILIVEGNTDIRVYERFIDKSKCIIIPSYGKDNAINALKILEKNNFKGILAIVDSDFWKLEKFKIKSSNLLITDTHDLETMILQSKALENILQEFGSYNKIKQLSKPIRDFLLESALPLGFFRWISSPTRDNLGLKFKEIFFNNFIDLRTLQIDIEKMINEVYTNTPNCSINKKAIKIKIITLLKKKTFDSWQVCSGHDTIQIFTIGLKNIFGNFRANTISVEILDGILRISYEYSYFTSTKLFALIKSWENLNKGYLVLK